MSKLTTIDIIYAAVDFWSFVAKYILAMILFASGPLWIIPYWIYKKVKYGERL